MLYHRGEMGRYHRLQSTALRIIAGIVLTTSLLALSVFFLPVERVLKLSVPRQEAGLTLYLLALQILWSIALGYIAGVFRVLGKAYRGSMWGNSQKLLLLACTFTLVLMKAGFWLIALVQLATVLTALVGVVFDLKRNAPSAFPTLRYWDKAIAKSAMKPSFFFGLFTLNNFLLFQAPVLLLNYFLGPVTVAFFSVARTLFSFGRQAISVSQHSIAPEITRLNGVQDKVKLSRLYNLSESVVLTAALVFNTGIFLLSPLLLQIWMQRFDLFSFESYLLMMLVSISMSVKEYKLYFQYATNNHSGTALTTFFSYLAMVVISAPVIRAFGVNGFLTVWIAAEVVQLFFIHRFNLRLLGEHGLISLRPVLKFGLTLFVAVVLFNVVLDDVIRMGNLANLLSAGAIVFALTVVSFFLFDLKSVLKEWRLRWVFD